jgi:hypothetical protein
VAFRGISGKQINSTDAIIMIALSIIEIRSTSQFSDTSLIEFTMKS